MFPRGTIYSSKKPGFHGEISLHADLKTKILYTLARGVGAGLVGFVIIAAIFTFGPLIKDEFSYNLGLNKINYTISQVDETNAQNTTKIQEEAQNFGVNSYFSLVIPKIGAKANIIANVDP